MIDSPNETFLITMKIIFEVEKFIFFPGSFQLEADPHFPSNYINL